MSRSLPLSINTSEAVKAIDTEILKLKPTVGAQSIASYITNIPIKASTTTVLPTPVPRATESDEEIDTNVVPYDNDGQRSPETSTRHSTFLFDWRLRTNSDITFVEPLHHNEDDLLTLLNRVHKPLLFGMTAGISLLMLLLLFFACPLRCSRRSQDKAMLLAEDLSAHNMSLPPSMMLGASKSVGVTTQDHEGACKSPATCSRYTLRV